MATKQKFGNIAPQKPRWVDVDQNQYEWVDLVDTETPLVASEQAPAPKRTAIRAAADTGLEVASGAVKGIKFMSDVFGTDNAVSTALDDVSKFAKSLQSAQAQGEDARMAQIMKEAEDKGIWEQVKAAASAASEAPIRQSIGAVATGLPMIAASMVPGMREAAWGTRLATMGGLGAAQGVGMVKSSMRDAVYQRAIEEGRSQQEAAALADQAQSYQENPGQIALGGLMGGAATATGFAPAMVRALSPVGANAAKTMSMPTIGKALSMGVLKEVPMEVAQGGHEQLAGNVAQNSAGFATPLGRGVAGSAAMDGMLAAPGGAVGGAFDYRSDRADFKAQQSEEAAAAKAEADAAAAAIRANKQPGSGPLSNAVNAGTEADAQKVEVAGASAAAAIASAPDLADTAPSTPSPEGSAEFINPDFQARQQTLAEQMASPENREKVRARFGDDGLNQVLYYAQAAGRADIPAKTSDNMLQVAERMMGEVLLQPLGGDAQLGGMVRDPLTLDAPEQTGAQPLGLGLDQTPSGRFTVDAQGNAVPETAVQRGDAQRRAGEMAGLGSQKTDILNPSGQPFKTKFAASLAAKKTPGEVVEVPGGYAVRAEQATPATKEKQAQPPAQQPILNNGKPFTLAEVGKANQAIGGTAVSVPGGWAIQPPATAQLPAEAPATAIQPAATPAASTQSAILGRNSQPIAEGGQPFATREEAKAEKRMHPLMRVAPAEGGGFILKPATERQLAAIEIRARQLALPQTGEKGYPSLHGFLVEKGRLNKSAMSDLGFDTNPVIGNRTLFSPVGMTLEQATIKAKAEGYIKSEDQNEFIEALKRSLNVSPVYTPDGYEAMAEAQMQARYEDFLAAEQDGGAENDWSRLTPEELAETGYNDYDEATQAEIRALVAQAEALGVDAESILEDVAQRTENATQKDYENAAKSAIEAAIRSSEESRSRDLGQAGAEAGPAAADTPAAPAAVTGQASDVRARNLAALKARMMAGQTKPTPATPPAQTKATPAPEAGPTNQGATNGQGQETLLKAEQPTGADVMVSGAPVEKKTTDTAKPGGAIEKIRKAAQSKVDTAPVQQPSGSIDGIVIKPGKGLIKGKFKAEVDGVGLPGDAFNTEQEAYDAALKYREVLAKRANEGAEAQRRKDAIADSFRNGDQVTNAQIESLGLKSDFSDMRWFMSTAADLFGLNSRQIRPIVKDLIKVRRSDMGTEYEYVPTRKALEAVAASQSLTSPTKADIESQQARAEQAEKSKAAQAKADAARAAKERERKEVAAASVAAADTFELGQDAMANLTGQQDVFGAMEQAAQPPQLEKRNIWIPNMTPRKLDAILAKQRRTADDIEDLKDFRYFLLTDEQSATEKGFYQQYMADGGSISVLKNKFWLTNIEAAIADGSKAEAEEKQARVDGRKAAKATTKMGKYDDEAKLYGYTVDASGAIFKGEKKLSPVVKEAKGRLRVESPDGKLLFSGAQTGEAFGEFLKSFWNAEKVDTGNEQGDDGLMFSRAAAKEVRDLVTLHNLSEDNLMYAGKMGGIPVPSIGITKVETPFGGFGEITLIAPKDLIDPESGVPVYDRDAWTARFPTLNFKKIKVKLADALFERMSAARDIGGDGSQFMSMLWDQMRNASTQTPDKITGVFTRYTAPKMLYAQEVLGKSIKPQMRSIKPETMFGHTKAWRDFVAKSDTRNMTEQREREFNREAAVAARAAMTELGETRKEGADERTARMLDSSLKSYLDRYITEDGMNAGILDRALRDVKSFGQKEIDPMKMDEAVRKVVPLDDAGYKKWVAGLVEPLFEAPTITVRGSEVPVTLENVVDAMTIGKTAGAEKSMTFGVGKAASMLGKQFKSIDEIKAARDQVVSASSEKEGKKSTEALISEYQNHVSAFYTGKDWKGNIDTWAALDSSLEALTKAGRNPTDGTMSIALQRSGFKRVDAKGISLAKQALEALRDATTDYFEAKPQRAVRLNEFKGAVVPKGTSAEAIALLEENGITVEVHGNAEGAREKAIQKLAKKLDGKTGNVIFSRDTESPRTPASTIRAAIEKAYGNLLDKLEGKGLVTIAQTEREAIEAAAQARADKTGGDVEQIKRQMLASVQMQRVWHGSPHRGIQQFSTDKIGTGEGAQAYGWGLYYASKHEIAEDYRKKLSGSADQSPRRFFMGQEFQPGTGGYFAARIVESSTLAKARKDVSEWIKDAETWSDRRKADKGEQETLRVWIDALAILKQAYSKSDFTKKSAQGQLYEVEIPEDGDMLLWDKPLSEQPAPAKNSAKTLKGDIAQDWLENELDRLNADWNELTGQELYKLVQRALVADALVPNAGSMAEQALIEGKTDKAASLLLMDDGIKGIKYLDGTSRNAGDGSYNYVIFDGADTQIVDVKYSANGNIEGFFDKQTGKSFLVADNLTAASAPGTLMHEVGIHMAAGGKLEPLFKRAGSLLKTGTQNEFIQRVKARMARAGETSDEEAAAYIVTEYENDRAKAPITIGKWLADLTAAVRAWLFSKGIILKADQLTIADIAAVARANARSMARGGPNGGPGGGIRHSFAGEGAATADKMELATARQRIEAGENAETVRKETGWFKGVDGKWRLEISDSDSILKDRAKWTAKIDAIKSKRDAALRKKFAAEDERNAFLRARGESPSRISTDTKKTSEFKELAKALKAADVAADKAYAAVALAERETLITIGDMLEHPALFAAYPGIADVRVQIDNNLPTGNAVYSPESQTITLPGKDGSDQILSVLLHEIQHNIQTIEGFASGGNPDANGGFSKYKRLAGEVEARNTEARKTLTDAQRRAIPPSQTADTPDSDVIVVFNGKDAMSAPAPANADSRTALPATLNIDGKDRPTTNSNGQPIHPTEEGVRNFWRWFADSRVVDEQGRPMVVYHGTTTTDGIFKFNTFAHFGTMRAANDRLQKTGGDAQSIQPVYLNLRNMLDVKDNLTLETPRDYAMQATLSGEIGRQEYRSLSDVSFDSDAVASLLESKGFDGLRYTNQYEDIGSESFVAFNPTQIKSATGNTGAFSPTDSDIRFSRGGGIADSVQQGAFSVKNATADQLAHYRGMGMQALGRRQIVDLYGDMLPELKQYDKLVQRMDADENESGADADKLVNEWAKLDERSTIGIGAAKQPGMERKLAELMHDATLAQIDPEKPLQAGDNADKHKELAARFAALTPKAQEVYRTARDMYAAHFKKVQAELQARIQRSGMDEKSKAKMIAKMDADLFGKLKGVYFPLARFGKYVVVSKNAAGETVSVSRAETLAEANNMRREVVKNSPAGITVSRVYKDAEFNATRDAAGKGFMSDLMTMLQGQGVSADVLDSVGQLYLSSLPDLSWAKHGIHRKGTPGFSQDARRAFAQHMFHGSRHLAKVRYSDQLADTLLNMEQRVKDQRDDEAFDQIKAQQVVDEMNKRHELLMNPKTNALSTAMTSVGFVWFLGLSPASALVNLSQTALVAYPVMASKWGFQKAGAALLSASAEVVRAGNDLSKVLAGEELAAFQKAVDHGTIDVTQAHDLAGVAQGEDERVAMAMRPVMRAASFMFHHAEKFNRQATFIAAYRLAKENGAGAESAFEQATKATYDGHFDYAASNRARIMQGNWQKVLFLFKQYGQNMVYTLMRQAYLSMNGMTDRQKAEARKQLGGLLTMHAMAAGALGLPIVGVLLSAASMLGSDDDDPWDAEVALKNTLADNFGPKSAEVMAHGLSRLTPWDLSGRVALNKLILPDIQEGLEGTPLWEKMLSAAAGPVAGIGGGIAKGMAEMGQGQYMRGLESMMPVALKNPIKAMRYAEEGAVDKTGVVIKDEVSLSGVAGQFSGFRPSDVALATEGRTAIYQANKALTDRRANIVRMYAQARMTDDAEGVQEVLKMVQSFNEKNPTRRITMPQLMQSVRGRTQRIEQAQQGVYLPKTQRDVVDAGRFAVLD